MSDPPETLRDPVTETLHGEEFVDPYRWLEADSAATERWVSRQNEYTDGVLGDLTAREALEPAMEALAETVEYEPITPTETGLFQRVKAADQDHSVLTVRERLDDDRRTLVDPNALSEDGSVSVDWYVPTPDGSLVAYGVATDGDEQYDVRILDIETGEIVDELPGTGRTGPHSFAWVGGGFHYVATGSAAEGDQLEKEVRYHELGSGEDDPVTETVTDPMVWPGLVTDPDGEHVLVAHSEGWERTDLYALREGELDPVLTGRDAIYHPRIRDGVAYLLTTDGAPSYRLVAIDLDDAEYDGDAALSEVLPEGEGVLESVAITDDRLVVRRDVDVSSSVEVYDLDGEFRRSVSLPGLGSVGSLVGSRGRSDAFLTYESFDQPRSTYRVRPESGGLDLLDEPETAPEFPITTTQEWYSAADGTEVPMFVVHREGVERNGTNPTLLYGYGGFEVSLTPSFSRFRLPFLCDGGVFVVANCRGGGEFGEGWHQAARHGRKQATFDDFIAAAETLIERGYTTAERLAIMGGSNGGLTVGAAITQRPELFRACVCAVPLLDMLRFHRFLLGESWTSEYGSPEEPEAFEHLRAYSPYQNVEDREYPAVLLKTAESDTRVHPFHARKMAAKLQHAQRGEEPILLRTESQTGHGVGKPVSKVIAEQLDLWGFLYDRLGVEPGGR